MPDPGDELAADPRAEISELVTLRDVLRYAVSCFAGSDLHYGHGSATPLDEAVFLILESLNLPVDDFNAFADPRLTAREKELLGERIALRIEKRLPAAYLTGRTYLAGLPFRSDERALVPRSYIADLLEMRVEDLWPERYRFKPRVPARRSNPSSARRSVRLACELPRSRHHGGPNAG